MPIKVLAHMSVLMLGITALFLSSSSPTLATGNLLTNPGAESNGTGWTTISNDGDGMSYNFDSLVHSGAQSFQTSHGLNSIYQTVDLLTTGHSAASLDGSPAINFRLWYATRNDQAGQYYAKFILLGGDGTTVIASTSFGDPTALIPLASGIPWTELNYTFSNYGSGARYARIEFGGQDQSMWAGHYGTHFDDAFISIEDPSITATATSGGGNSMPSSGYVPPTGPFHLSLQSGSLITPSTKVLLNISASPDVDRMALSKYPDFHDSGIVPLASSVPWSLCDTPACEPGTYTVYAKFYQSYGLASPLQQLTIIHAPASNEPLNIQSAPFTSATTTSVNTEPKAINTLNAPVFTKNLRPGDRGADVKQLQQFLNTNNHLLATQGIGSPGNETEVFGPALRRALARFQETYAKTLLHPLGLNKGTGVFGTQTRNFINTLSNTVAETNK